MENTDNTNEMDLALEQAKQAYDNKLFALAVKWLTKAAEAGHTKAQYHLGLCYYYGYLGLKMNNEEAIKWFREAAHAGLTDAKRKLGHILPYNDPEAYQMLKECGDTEEAERLLDIHQRMI